MVRHWTTLVSHGRFAHPCLRGFCPRGFARQVRSAPTRYDLICSRLYALNTAIRLTQTLRQLRRSAMSTSACRYCGVLKNKRTRLTKCLILFSVLMEHSTAQYNTLHRHDCGSKFGVQYIVWPDAFTTTVKLLKAHISLYMGTQARIPVVLGFPEKSQDLVKGLCQGAT